MFVAVHSFWWVEFFDSDVFAVAVSVRAGVSFFAWDECDFASDECCLFFV